MQGETDARYSSSAHTYSRNLAQFVRALRKELDSHSLAFFMGQVDPPIKIFPYRDIVRQAQKNSTAQIRNSRLISTEGLKKRNDNLHYNTEGQITLGLRFAEAVIQVAR
jgi:lysophospholipase L1-like esterase